MVIRCSPLALLTLGFTLLAGCATSEPTLTDNQTAADKTWFVGAYEVGGQSAAPGQDATTVIDINPALMSVEGAAGCGTFYGSFTLGTDTDPTVAGFTIPGRSSSDCDASVRATQERVIEALEATTAFSYDGDDLVLTGPQSSVTLIPAG